MENTLKRDTSLVGFLVVLACIGSIIIVYSLSSYTLSRTKTSATEALGVTFSSEFRAADGFNSVAGKVINLAHDGSDTKIALGISKDPYELSIAQQENLYGLLTDPEQTTTAQPLPEFLKKFGWAQFEAKKISEGTLVKLQSSNGFISASAFFNTKQMHFLATSFNHNGHAIVLIAQHAKSEVSLEVIEKLLKELGV